MTKKTPHYTSIGHYLEAERYLEHVKFAAAKHKYAEADVLAQIAQVHATLASVISRPSDDGVHLVSMFSTEQLKDEEALERLMSDRMSVSEIDEFLPGSTTFQRQGYLDEAWVNAEQGWDADFIATAIIAPEKFYGGEEQ